MSDIIVDRPVAEPPPPARGRRQRALDALDERLGLKGLQYPVPAHANTLAYSLGGLSLISFVLMVATGIFLTQYYNPDPAAARDSVRHIITGVTLGSFVRAFHYWGAMAMIVLVGLHLLRVFASASFKRPREGNWVVGVALAGITAGLFFTGSVLKWDQESLEALEHNIEVGKLLGKFGFWFSNTFGGIPLLTRLYVVHISVLPALFTLAVAIHLLLVKRHGMAPSPFGDRAKDTGPEPTRPFTRHLVELGVLALVLVGVLTVLAVLLPPPHGPAPIEGIEVTKPPWPLLWVYPVEDWVGVSGILWATLAIFAALLAVPLVDRSPERHPLARRRLPVTITAAVVVLFIIGLIVYAAVQPVATHIGM
jgi:quinol-cytochrome oxidoreductase complex cytochrome b subunit